MYIYKIVKKKIINFFFLEYLFFYLGHNFYASPNRSTILEHILMS